jgi:hypothetical protein
MKKFITLAILMYSIPAFSAENIGKEVSPASTNGQSTFGVQFAHDTDLGINGNFTVNGRDLANSDCFSSLAYRFYNSATGAYISDWVNEDSSTTGCAALTGTYPIQIHSTDAGTVTTLLSNLPNIKLVLAVNFSGANYEATNYIDLSALCKTSPQNFIDLTTGKTGCDIQL